MVGRRQEASSSGHPPPPQSQTESNELGPDCQGHLLLVPNTFFSKLKKLILKKQKNILKLVEFLDNKKITAVAFGLLFAATKTELCDYFCKKNLFLSSSSSSFYSMT